MKERKPIHDNWKTPEETMTYIYKKYFTHNGWFDPCPINHDMNWNGLEIEWQEENYINPPYNKKDKEAFIIKAYQESLKRKLCVMLLPVSTSTKIFHTVILPHAKIEFLFKRVKFEGINSKGEFVSNKCGMHDSMIVVFDGRRL